MKRHSIKSENPGPLQSLRYLIEFLLLSARVHPALLWRPPRNIAATLSSCCPADALEVSMATRMASHDFEGQSEPINGTMLRDKKKNKIRIKSQIMLLVTFIPALPKKCLFFNVCLFSSFTIVFLFMQACDDCLLSVYKMYRGKNMNAFFLGLWLTFNNIVAVTLQSKSFKWNLMWNSVLNYYGSLIDFFP